MILPLFGDSRPLLQISTATRRHLNSLHLALITDTFFEHLNCHLGPLPSHPAPMLSYNLANIASFGSISFTFPLVLLSTTQLPSNPLNLIPCLQAAMLELGLNYIGLEQGPGRRLFNNWSESDCVLGQWGISFWLLKRLLPLFLLLIVRLVLFLPHTPGWFSMLSNDHN